MLTKRSRRACLFQSLLIFSTYSKMLRGIPSHVSILKIAILTDINIPDISQLFVTFETDPDSSFRLHFFLFCFLF
jgi:hypothetical protein